MTRRKYPHLPCHFENRMRQWLRLAGYRYCHTCEQWKEGSPRSQPCKQCATRLRTERAERRSAITEPDDWGESANKYFAEQVKAAQGYYSDPKILEHLSRLAGVRL